MKNIYKLFGMPAFLMACMVLLVVSCQEGLDLDKSATDELIAYENGSLIPGKYIVVLHESQLNFKKEGAYDQVQASMRKEVSALLASHRISSENLDKTYSKTIEGFSVNLNEEEAARLRQDGRVKFIEQDRLIALAPPPGKGPGNGGGDGGSTGQEIPYGVTRVGGPVNYTGNQVAYILDTGIDLDHPDLNVDAAKGFNTFTTGKDGKDLNDNNGHGTHVAGTVAAIDNEIGVVGVAAGAAVVPVKVLDQRGSGTYSGVIAGVDFVGGNGTSGDVANMSLGGPVSQALDDAVLAASNQGIYFSIAAGNSQADANNYSPARVNGSQIYTVSAMDINDNFASFSNFGNPPVDWSAPGVSITSTWKDGGYNTISGTSMAAPHVAGVRLLGNISQDGTVKNDPDGFADPIASH